MKRKQFSLRTLFVMLTLLGLLCGGCIRGTVILERSSGVAERASRVRCGCLSFGFLDRAGDGHGWLLGAWWQSLTSEVDPEVVDSPLVELSIPWSSDGFPSGRLCNAQPRQTG